MDVYPLRGLWFLRIQLASEVVNLLFFPARRLRKHTSNMRYLRNEFLNIDYRTTSWLVILFNTWCFFWIPPNHPSHQIINVVNRFTVDPWWPGDPRKTRLPSPWACLAFLVAAFWTWTSTVWNFIKWPGRLLEDDDIEYSITNLSLSLYIYIIIIYIYICYIYICV